MNVENIHPLHKAIMEECCENVLSQQDKSDNLLLVAMVQAKFSSSLPVLQGILRAALQVGNADQVTLNYRQQTFIIPAKSKLLS